MSKFSVLDSLFDGILVIDWGRNILFANKLYLEICGLDKEEIRGKNICR